MATSSRVFLANNPEVGSQNVQGEDESDNTRPCLQTAQHPTDPLRPAAHLRRNRAISRFLARACPPKCTIVQNWLIRTGFAIMENLVS
jgi:hypothetical protein